METKDQEITSLIQELKSTAEEKAGFEVKVEELDSFKCKFAGEERGFGKQVGTALRCTKKVTKMNSALNVTPLKTYRQKVKGKYLN